MLVAILSSLTIRAKSRLDFSTHSPSSISATRDVSSEAGNISSSEGDTAGYSYQLRQIAEASVPVADTPAQFTNTDIVTTVDCHNTTNNANSDPQLDANRVIFSRVRAYGDLAWSYEVPCATSTKLDPSTVPSSYTPPVGVTYQNGTVTNASWQKGDDNKSAFPH